MTPKYTPTQIKYYLEKYLPHNREDSICIDEREYLKCYWDAKDEVMKSPQYVGVWRPNSDGWDEYIDTLIAYHFTQQMKEIVNG